jgi:SAM-dependent methyltransferase
VHPLLLPIRELELDAVRGYLPPGCRVLELGAGNGWQARRLTEWGFDVRAVDVERAPTSYFDVALYDGVHLPLEDASVDVVYSSNVFEHVQDVPGLLADCRRVLAPGGRAVHVLPSPIWRGWSILARYPFLAQLALHRRVLPAAEAGKADPWQRARGEPRALGRGDLLKKILVEQPHGEFPSAASELFHYRAAVWRRKFEDAGYRVVEQRPVGLFYSSYGVSGLGLERRRRLAQVFGSACTVFVLEPA